MTHQASLSPNDLALQSSRPPNNGSGKFLPAVQIAYSLVAALLYMGTALTLVTIGLLNQINQGDSTPARLISLGWSSGLIGFLLLPAAVLAIFRLSNRDLPGWITRLLKYLDQVSLFLILAWPVVLITGYLAARLTRFNWLLMPPFNLLAVGLPIIWLLAIGRRQLPAGSPLRHWGILSVGVVLTPILAFIIELAVLFGLAVLIFILLASNPNASAELTRISQRLMLSQGDPETIMRILRPLLAQPMVIFGGLAIMSGLIPLIEELLKPLPVWLLGKRLTTPAEGFVAGLIGGAGFTLAESLGASSAFEPSQWITVTFARAGTDLLHILNAGLMGWALVCAWQQRKYLRLALTYLLVVAIHGLWNFFSLWAGFYSLITPAPQDLFTFPRSQAIITPIGLGLLVVAMLAILIWRNASLRRGAVALIQGGPPTQSGFHTLDGASPTDIGSPASGETTVSSETSGIEDANDSVKPDRSAEAQGASTPIEDAATTSETLAGESPEASSPDPETEIDKSGNKPTQEDPPSDIDTPSS